MYNANDPNHMYEQRDRQGCTAILSNDDQYRYYLSRAWDGHQRISRTLGVIMLNPSTADAFADDPTIRKIIAYAKRWGYNRIAVGNLYAWRATDPRELPLVANPSGDWQHSLWERILREADGDVLCGWGSNKMAPAQALMFWQFFHQYKWHETRRLVTIRVSEKTGMPYHPLYQKGDLEPFEWRMPT